GREANIRRNAGSEPTRRICRRQMAGDAREHAVVQHRRRGIRNQGGDMRHARASKPCLKRAVLIAGPTASGKSGLAAALAQELDGIIINADSMQVYRDLRILTARPSADEETRAPHRLYGHVDAAQHYSVGHWLREVGPVLAEAVGEARLPIL